MIKILVLSIGILSIQSIINLVAAEDEFSEILNGKYSLTNEEIGKKSIMNCDLEVNLFVENNKLFINDGIGINFTNDCKNGESTEISKICETSTSVSYEAEKHFTIAPDNSEGLSEHSKYYKIALSGFKNNKIIIKEVDTQRTGNETFFNRPLVRKIKCTYERL